MHATSVPFLIFPICKSRRGNMFAISPSPAALAGQAVRGSYYEQESTMSSQLRRRARQRVFNDNETKYKAIIKKRPSANRRLMD